MVAKDVNSNVKDCKCMLWLFGHMERMERDRIVKRIYVGECAGSHSMGRPQKRWINTMKEYFRKRGLNVRQIWKMMQDRNEW